MVVLSVVPCDRDGTSITERPRNGGAEMMAYCSLCAAVFWAPVLCAPSIKMSLMTMDAFEKDKRGVTPTKWRELIIN